MLRKPDFMQSRYLVLESAGEKLQFTQTCSKGILGFFWLIVLLHFP